MKEIEILIEIKDDKDKVLGALESLPDIVKEGEKETLDIYFYDPMREDLQPNADGRLNTCFRLRSKAGKYHLAYKVDHFLADDEWSHSDEYETDVADFDHMMNIIERLGLKELIRIDNIKHIFKNSEYEIALEDVKDLGLFMEIEKLEQVGDEGVAEAKNEIRNFIQKLSTEYGIQFGVEQNAGKPELMLRKGYSGK